MVRILTGAVSVVATTLLLATTTAATAHTIETRVDTQKSAGFRASDGSVAFALNIPQNDTNGDLYFTMSGPSSQSWIAIGMGNDRMEDSLIFMAYASNNGTGITLSPRLSYGHIEPSYTPDVNFTLETGSGIVNGNYTINAICTNCRAWKGMETDALNPTNTAAKFIFASGPSGSLNTNDMRVSLKRHGSFGAFTMNLNDAFGKRGMPIIQFADFGGSKETQDKKDNDFSSVLHGCMMILAFVGLMPMGILILRLLGSAKYHGWNQAASSAIAILGAFLGVYCGTTYNRSRSFNSAHQIFGLFITLAMIGQFILGFLHHRTYKKTLSPTKLSTPHIWLGRIVIPLGIANGFLGFPLALNSKYNWVLLALTLLVVLVMGPFAWWAWKRNERKNRPRMGVVQDESDGPGYQSQPWRTEVGGASQSDINLPSYGDGQSQGQMHPPLGGYQAPRGFA